MEKRYTIGVLIGNSHTNHPKGLLRGICDSAKEQNVNVVFFLGTQTAGFYREMVQGHDNFDYQYNTIYDYVMLARVDVLIIAYGSLCIFWDDTDKQKFLSRFGNIPYIILEDLVEDERGIHIIADNFGGIKKCLEHLIEEHHCRNIAFLSGPKKNKDARERLNAYRTVMKLYKLPCSERQIAYGGFGEHEDELVEKLLADNPHLEAIVSANDEMTVAIYRVCQAHGLEIGKDILVTGFDNTSTARYARPALTTVLQDSYKMGKMAFSRALRIAAGENVISGRLETELIVRQSCGCGLRQGVFEGCGNNMSPVESELRENVNGLVQFQRMAWMSPHFMRDLMQDTSDVQNFYTKSVRTLMRIGAKSVAIYLLKNPLIHNESDVWRCPKKMYLAAYSIDNKIITYEKKDRPLITEQNGFLDVPQLKDKKHIYMNFLLFEGKRQYGVLALEIEPDTIPYYYMMALQLGTALRFLELSIKERQAKEKLREKNEVLGFIASYDELTGIYNRRGIMEQLVEFNHRHAGEAAYLMIGDLDHLKEINDSFGHSEGDCAIRTAAGIIKGVFGKLGDIGRIGGDEFVGVFLSDVKVNKGDLMEQIHQGCETYNRTSGKPYYVNISLGAVEFVCGDRADFKEMLRHADEFLYEAKKNRRDTIRKEE